MDYVDLLYCHSKPGQPDMLACMHPCIAPCCAALAPGHAHAIEAGPPQDSRTALPAGSDRTSSPSALRAAHALRCPATCIRLCLCCLCRARSGHTHRGDCACHELGDRPGVGLLLGHL
jgi:hypothetical protein